MRTYNLKKIIEDYLIKNKNKLKINSNNILKGDVFVALQGKKNHGNEFVADALNKGAKYIITDKKLDLNNKKDNILLLDDVLLYLSIISNKKRNIFKGKVIGITGSVGKTTIKENLKYCLSFVSNVSASIKSYNNYLGVLVSLINMDCNCNFAIFEIGTNNFKEIRKLTSIILPQQVIVTNIFPTHLENFKNTRNVAVEKSDIFNPKFNPAVEFLILPNSNVDVLFLHEEAKKTKISQILTLGKEANSNYHIRKITRDKKSSIVEIIKNKKIYKIQSNKKLYHQVFNLTICLMIFEYNNLSVKTIYDKAKNIPLIDGRGLENKVFINGKKVRFIDESYNASPATMKICINYFNEIKLSNKQKKYIILGDMNELGTDTIFYHKDIIKKILDYNFDNAILCGKLFNSALKTINIKKNQIRYMSNENAIMEYLKRNLHNNDIILIKGSNSTKVNKLAKSIIINKE